MSVRGRGWRRKKEQDGTWKMLTTRTTIVGLGLVKWDCEAKVKVFGGLRNNEGQHERIEGASLVSE